MSNVHVMTKPVGSKCNLDCDYCFYLEKENLYQESHFEMSDQLLEEYVKQHIESQEKNVEYFTFAWQGGEPALRGLPFYKKAVSFQKKYAMGKECQNTFQTNGLLINDEWCSFFKEHNFLIGISIDGNQEQHDIYRKTRSGKGSHQKVVNAIDKLNAYAVDYNALIVVHDVNVNSPIELYHYLKSIGIKYMQFSPIVERHANEADVDGLHLIDPSFQGDSSVSEWSVPSLGYGQFLAEIFHAWKINDLGNVFITNFENTMGLHLGADSNSCIHAETCGTGVALEHNGDVYSCDHFVYPKYKLGNISESSIKTMSESEQQQQFGKDKVESLDPNCKACKFLKLCNGGCPKDRFLIDSSGKPNKNYLCEGYFHYFMNTEPDMKIIVNGFTSGHSIQTIRKEIAT